MLLYVLCVGLQGLVGLLYWCGWARLMGGRDDFASG